MHIHHLLLQIGAILLLGRLLGRVVRWMGQPVVIAEILAGILLGPSVLGLLWPGSAAAMFPPDSLPTLGTLAELGLVFFMFFVGMEFDPSLLQGRARSAIAISNAGILAPLVAGVLAALVLPDALRPDGVPMFSYALFVGVSLSVTAFPVLARILTERRLVRTPVGALALAAAAFGDVTAWCLLSVVVAIASASGLGSALGTLVLAATYIAFVVMFVRPALARVGPREGREVSTEVVALTVLLIVASSFLTDQIGIHALFGGFAIGAAMPRRSGVTSALSERLEDFITIVLLPLFFAFSGLRTSIGLLDSAGDWWTLLALLIVATAGKFGGAAAAARWTGMSLRESAAIGILMNTRGLMEIVVLNIGLDLGVISDRMFAMMVLVALITTWMTTPILKALYPPELAEAGAPHRGAPAGVLLAVSDPRLAVPLVRLARLLSGSEPVWALHLRPVDRPRDYLNDAFGADEPLDAIAREASRVGLRYEPMSFPSGEPAEDIARVAERKNARLVLLGTHRSSLGGDNLGGVAGGVLRTCVSAVGVLLDRGLTEARRVRIVDPGPWEGFVGTIEQTLVAAGMARAQEVGDPEGDLTLYGLTAEGVLPAMDGVSSLLLRGPRPG